MMSGRRFVTGSLMAVLTVLVMTLPGCTPVSSTTVAAAENRPGTQVPPLRTAVPPGDDAFYRPPTPLPSGEPGDLIRFRHSTAYAAPPQLAPVPAAAWQILYYSTSALEQPVAVSGTVPLPHRPWRRSGPRPIVGYAVGTHGLGDQCAPSYQLASGTEQELGLISQALAAGWAVAVTDYEALGTPGDHTYTVAESEGRAMLDAVRAALQLPDTGLSDDSPVGIWGYSQGGGAAAFAGELQPSYAPELEIRGVAPGGVPADLLSMAEHLDGSPSSGLLIAGAIGFNAAYPELNLEELLNDTGRALVADLRDECVAQISRKGANRRMAALSTIDDPVHHPPLVARLSDNRPGETAPTAPVRLYHAQFDQLIPIGLARDLFADYCELGTSVQFQTVPAVDHVGGAVAGAPQTIAWLADRFAGRPAPSSCP